jgi:hypothetical protein
LELLPDFGAYMAVAGVQRVQLVFKFVNLAKGESRFVQTANRIEGI